MAGPILCNKVAISSIYKYVMKFCVSISILREFDYRSKIDKIANEGAAYFLLYRLYKLKFN